MHVITFSFEGGASTDRCMRAPAHSGHVTDLAELCSALVQLGLRTAMHSVRLPPENTCLYGSLPGRPPAMEVDHRTGLREGAQSLATAFASTG